MDEFPAVVKFCIDNTFPLFIAEIDDILVLPETLKLPNTSNVLLGDVVIIPTLPRV